MVDVLTWTIERRMRLTERAELLRKELAEVDAELGRLEAAEVVFGQWAEGDGRGTAAVGHRGAGAGAGAGARRGWAGCGRDAVGAGPCRGDGTGVPDLGVSADHTDRGRGDGPVMAKDIAMALGRDSHRARSSRSAVSCANSPTGAG
jgi:hypothetical protein